MDFMDFFDFDDWTDFTEFLRGLFLGFYFYFYREWEEEGWGLSGLGFLRR